MAGDANRSGSTKLLDSLQSEESSSSKNNSKLRSRKVQLTLRLDADVIDFFRSKGSGYQRRMADCMLLMMDQGKFRAATENPGEPWIPEHPTHSAMSNTIFRPRKEQMALRLDAELIDYFRSLGKGYQTKMNRALRLMMVEMISTQEGQEE